MPHQGLAKTLGIEFVEFGKEKVVARMPVTPGHHQPFGYLHGGASAALAEHAASTGAQLFCPPGYAAFGLEININHVRKKQSGEVFATAIPKHIGRSTQVWTIEITDESGRLIALGRCTMAVVPLDSAPRNE